MADEIGIVQGPRWSPDLHELPGGFLALLFSHSIIWLFVTPWTAAHQAFLSFTISQSLLKLMSIESVMLSTCPLMSPSPLAFNLFQHQGLFQ